MEGKLIVFDGVDACGKTTQTKIFVDRLQKEGYTVKDVKYPRYDEFYGKLTGRYLKGDFGDVDINPYLSCLPFVLDRLDHRDELLEWLGKGGILVCDRYATSTTTFSGAKIKDPLQRAEFIKWHEECEYIVNRLPKADIIVFLEVPMEVSQKLLEEKGYRNYMEGEGKDIHERDVEYLEEVDRFFKEQIAKSDKWIHINCMKDGKLMSKEEIAGIVWEKVKDRL